MFEAKRFFAVLFFTFFLFFLLINSVRGGYYSFFNPLFYLIFSFLLIWFFKNFGIKSVFLCGLVCVAAIWVFYTALPNKNASVLLLLLQILIFVFIPAIFSILIISKKFTLTWAVALPVLIIYFLIFAAIAFFIYSAHINLYAALNKSSILVFNKISRVYETIGISSSAIAKLKPALMTVVKDGFLLLPAILIVFSWIGLWSGFIIVKKFLKADEHGFFEKAGDLMTWRSSDFFIIVLLTGLGIVIFSPGLFKFLGYNIIVVSSSVYFIQGLTIIAFFFKKVNLNLFLRILSYALIFLFSNPFVVFVVLMGILDEWLNFRKLNLNNLTEPPKSSH